MNASESRLDCRLVRPGTGYRLKSHLPYRPLLVVGLALCSLVAKPSLHAEPWLPDRASPTWYRFVIVAGGEAHLEAGVRAVGDVHANGNLFLKRATLVEGDASAGDTVNNLGTVSGGIEAGAALVSLPVLPPAGELRALADRSFEGNLTLIDATIDDVVFVSGNVEIRGTLEGRGAILAGGALQLRAGPAPGVASTRLTLVAAGDVRLGPGRLVRGALRAGHDVVFEAGAALEGALIAGNKVLLKRDSVVTFSSFDLEPPQITTLAPEPGSLLTTPTPAMTIAIADSFSGLDAQTLRFQLDGDDVTATAQPSTAEWSLQPAHPLLDGPHVLQVAASDAAGNVATEQAGFTTDTTPPGLTLIEPSPGQLVATGSFEVSGTVTDANTVVSVMVNEVPALLTGSAFTATVALAEGGNPILVTALDAAGYETMAAGSVVYDARPPLLTLDTPAAGQRTHEATLRFAGTVADDVELASLEVAGQSLAVVDGQFETDIALAEGVSTVVVRARDRAGHTTELALAVERFSLPTVLVTAPADGSLTTAGSIVVSGQVSGADVVLVQGAPATLTAEAFTAEVAIEDGRNTIDVVAIGPSGGRATAKLAVYRDGTPPRVTIDAPLDGSVVHEPTLAVSGLVNDVAPGTATAGSTTVTVDGLPAAVGNRGYLLGELVLTPGMNDITAIATDPSGNVGSATVRVTFAPPLAPWLALASGNLQAAPIATPLPEPLVVQVRDAAGAPLPDARVIFHVVAGGGRFENGRRRILATSDASGRAAVSFTLGKRAGVGSHRVEASFVGLAGRPVFLATALPGAPAHLHVDTGSQQTGTAGRALPDPFVAVVTDLGFNRLEGVPVGFRVVAGQGRFGNGLQEITVPSDPEGRARAVLVLDPEEKVAGNVVEAFLPDSPEVPFVSFTATGLLAGDPAATTVSGIVLDNVNHPVPGATVHIRGTQLSTTTDAGGLFQLLEAPVGTFLLEIDASTTSRPGVWPHLEFEMTTVAGRDNTLAMPIFVLPIEVEHGLSVSETTGGTLTLPDIPIFALEIAPGSVTFPDGSRSGNVSVTQVHFDKIPMVPSFGQQPRFVITIQPAGARFDPPARLTLPNVDGLAAGEVTELYSFDHDLRAFVSIGPATVSDDATQIVSNPGVGVVEAGWHHGGNPAPTGTPHDCPRCQRCSGSACVPDDSQGCELGDRCQANARCEGGACVGDPRRVIEVEATANGQKIAVVDLGEAVVFKGTVEHEYCDPLDLEWDLDAPDTPLAKPASRATVRSGPFVVTYDEPGAYRFSLEADCSDGCDHGSDNGVVLVRCPRVSIVRTDPDLEVLCPGCSMTFFAEVMPEGAPVWWELVEGQERATLDVINPSLMATIKAKETADAGNVTIRAYVPRADEVCPGASDQRTVTVFVPPDLPKIFGITPGEIIVGLSVLIESLTNSAASECLAVLSDIKPVAISASEEIWDHNRPGCEYRDNAAPNAILHAMGSCIAAAACGQAFGEAFWDGHEDYAGNNCDNANIDFRNNDEGRALAVPGRPELCPLLVRGALLGGGLVWKKDPAIKGCGGEALFDRDLSPSSPCLRDPQSGQP